MITIIVAHVTKIGQEFEEFLKSLSYSHSGENPYEVVSDKVMFDDKINFVKNPSDDSVIQITLPDSCILLGNAWDRYIKYALDNGLPKHGLGRDFVPSWENYVQGKMGLQSRRPPEGIFPELKVHLSTE